MQNYNLIHDVKFVSGESTGITEPVSLSEMKNYMRLNGFLPDDDEGLSIQQPLSLSMAEGELAVTSSFLIGDDKVITGLQRDGIGYTKTEGSPGDRQFAHDTETGTISFQTTAGVGGVTIDIQYGIPQSGDEVSLTSDDDLIEELITAARQAIEKYTWLSLIPKTVRVCMTNLAGEQELPYGPVGEVEELLYEDAEEDPGHDDYENKVSDVKTTGFDFKCLREPNACKMIIEYSAGYGTAGLPAIPKGLKIAIMMEVLYRYEHRGEEFDDDGICKAARIKAAPFKRETWLV